MKIVKEFTVARPFEVVWAFFSDIPAVAACLPGAEHLGQREDGQHSGKVTAKVGPFQASFEGEAKVDFDETDKRISVEGKGVDKKGGSRGKMTMVCSFVPEDGSTRVTVDADVMLSGAIAQFGRTGLISEIANVMIADFVANAEAVFAAAETGTEPVLRNSSQPLSASRLLTRSIKGWIKS